MYMKPLEQRMKSQLQGPKYRKFRKSCVQSSIFTGRIPPLSILDSDAKIEVPCLKISPKGLSDRVHKYELHSQKERELGDFIQKSKDLSPQPPVQKERKTLDLSSYRMLMDTRIYAQGNGGCPKGRKFIPTSLESSVDECIDQF